MGSKLNVQIVYRNYIPLNSPYSSFWTHPPEGVEFHIPRPKTYLKHLYPIYRKYSQYQLVRAMIHWGQKIVFTQPQNDNSADCYFYIGVLPDKIPDKPFFVDIEHSSALVNFVECEVDPEHTKRVFDILGHPLCKGIVPLSKAAEKSLHHLFGKEFEALCDKIQVIYPALPVYQQQMTADFSLVEQHSSRDHFNVLFVGKEPVGKGLYELLRAWDGFLTKRPTARAHLYVVTQMDPALKQFAAGIPHISFFPGRFTTEQLMQKLMLCCDVLVMPTHLDSFGMVNLEALACGMPVIATHQFAIPEIIRHGVNGNLLTHKPLYLDRRKVTIPKDPKKLTVDRETFDAIVNGIEHHLERLYSQPSLLQQLKNATLDDLSEDGCFSIPHRNNQLTRLFEM